MAALNSTIFEEWWWRYGRPAELWTVYRDVIAHFIRERGLKAIPDEVLVAPAQAFSAEASEVHPVRSLRIIRPRPFPGGLRFPHLHFGDDIYPLDRGQWNEFSGKVVEGFQEKLGAAQTVSFRQLLDLGEAMSELG